MGAVRVGFKASATTLNVSLEGRFIGAGFQTGAVDARAYTKYSDEVLKYKLRGGAVDPSSYKTAQKELKEINSGIYIVDSQTLNQTIPLIDNKNAQSEYYLTDIFNFIDEKNRSVELTDDGYVLVEELLEESEMLGDSEGLYSVSNLQIMKFVQATLRAHFLFLNKFFDVFEPRLDITIHSLRSITPNGNDS